ncbi:hypothetical protein EST38_g8182 [Candolleomyces aberdarensis]|uniref:Spindle assembly checkpoint component MAD1 n=1 Tax=Candolleomyces aberdarensis TaxID=2316362 RepID=A0A4Q2DD84_9AGAR|nr:hypothetical protein EST38_g8182 [Candolleomyces aberdarensis]
MNNDNFKTPLPKSRYTSSIPTATKRDSLAAELERDPQLSTAKRRTQLFNSSVSHANLERQLLAAQTANAELETKLRERELQIERLERDRRYFADREKEEREEKEQERGLYEEAKRKTDAEMRTLRHTLTTLREEYADLQDSHSSLNLSTSQATASQKSLITTLEHRISLLSSELSQATQIADERSRTLNQLQMQYDELQAAHEEVSSAPSDDMHVVREELKKQQDYLRQLESTNTKLTKELNFLRERNTNAEVLKEEKRGLEKKLIVLEELRDKVVRLEAELDAARSEREEWGRKAAEEEDVTMFNTTPSKRRESSGVPVAVTQTLSTLRLAHAKLLEEHGSTAALLKRREAELANLEKREIETQEVITGLESDLRSVEEELKRKEAGRKVAEREVRYLEALLASYKAEETYAASSASTTLAPSTSSLLDESKLAHLDELEGLVEEYKEMNEQLAHRVDELEKTLRSDSKDSKMKVVGGVDRAELEKVEKERDELKETLKSHEAEIQTHLTTIDNLEQTLFELSGEMAGGRHVPPNTRVLCLKENPDQQWLDLRQETLDRLKGENEALIRRLGELEERVQASGGGVQEMGSGTGKGGELVPRESWEQVCKEKEELVEEVKQKEKRLLRLQQVFTSKSAEFREAIASILGLKLAFYPNGQVRVTSMYDLAASFIFQPTGQQGTDSSGMKMQLVAQGEGGPQDLPNLMHYWIENEQCPPGFMASVTLECYDNWKRNQQEEA